jgi:hypothetical protein
MFDVILYQTRIYPTVGFVEQTGTSHGQRLPIGQQKKSYDRAED